MQLRQETTLISELAVYTHCSELYKSRRAEIAGRLQLLVSRSRMHYLQENVVAMK
jgi:hypothetical protein